MTWLLAVVFQPLGALILFGLAAAVAVYVLRPLLPNGRVKDLLYDRTLQKRYPWRFAILALSLCWGIPALIALYLSH